MFQRKYRGQIQMISSSQCNQVILDVRKNGGGERAEVSLENANIIGTKIQLPFDPETYHPDLAGKLAAISFVFSVESERLHDLMERENIAGIWGKGGFTRIAEALIKTGGKIIPGATIGRDKE